MNQPEQQNVIHELNDFLEGQYMGIHQYERLIQHTHDTRVKEVFQQIQQDHKQNALKVSERIQDLGGSAVDGVGIMGQIGETMQLLKGTPEDTNLLLKEACNGEEMGIRKSEQIVRGDLDVESRQIIEEVLDVDRRHVELLKELIH